MRKVGIQFFTLQLKCTDKSNDQNVSKLAQRFGAKAAKEKVDLMRALHICKNEFEEKQPRTIYRIAILPSNLTLVSSFC